MSALPVLVAVVAVVATVATACLVLVPPGATESVRLVELDLDAVPDERTGGVDR